MKDVLRGHFESFHLPPPAIDYLLVLWEAIQFFDDVVDCKKVDRKDFDSVLWNMFVGLPMNQFYVTYSAHLLPVLSNAILKWQASDHAERNSTADAKSFVWRASYYDIVLTVVQLCHGPQFAIDNAESIMRLYGENFNDYMKEYE